VGAIANVNEHLKRLEEYIMDDASADFGELHPRDTSIFYQVMSAA
jgi:hypothetical protein